MTYGVLGNWVGGSSLLRSWVKAQIINDAELSTQFWWAAAQVKMEVQVSELYMGWTFSRKNTWRQDLRGIMQLPCLEYMSAREEQ